MKRAQIIPGNRLSLSVSGEEELGGFQCRSDVPFWAVSCVWADEDKAEVSVLDSFALVLPFIQGYGDFLPSHILSQRVAPSSSHVS